MGAAPEGKIYPGPICDIMQKLTPIGATVADISVTGQWKNNSNQIYPQY